MQLLQLPPTRAALRSTLTASGTDVTSDLLLKGTMTSLVVRQK